MVWPKRVLGGRRVIHKNSVGNCSELKTYVSKLKVSTEYPVQLVGGERLTPKHIIVKFQNNRKEE